MTKPRDFSTLSQARKESLLENTAFVPLEVRTHYRSTLGPRQSMRIVEEPLWHPRDSWCKFSDGEK